MEKSIILNVYGKNENIEKISFSKIKPIMLKEHCKKVNSTDFEDGTWVSSQIIKENQKIKITDIKNTIYDFDGLSNYVDTPLENIIVFLFYGFNETIDSITFLNFKTCEDAIIYCKTINNIGIDTSKWTYAKIIEFNNKDIILKKPEPKEFKELEVICNEVINNIAEELDPYGYPLLIAISDNEKIIERIGGSDFLYKGFNSAEKYIEYVQNIKKTYEHEEIKKAKLQLMEHVMKIGFSK